MKLVRALGLPVVAVIVSGMLVTTYFIVVGLAVGMPLLAFHC